MTTTKFCTVADVKLLAMVDAAWTAKDAKIAAFITTATALIRAYTRRNWELASYTEFFNTADIDAELGVGQGPMVFTLSNFPVSGEPVVKYSPKGDFANVDALVKDVDYYVQVEDDRTKIIFYSQYVIRSQRSLQIVYSAGYSPDGTDSSLLVVNELLKQACTHQAAFLYARSENSEGGQTSKTNQRGSAQFKLSPAGLIPEVQAMLKGYVKLMVGRW